MFNLKKGIIFHTRGDTADFDVNIKVDDEPIIDYTAVFSVKKQYKDKDYLFQCPVEDGHVHISHETTQELPFGDYYCDIEVRIPDGTEEGRYITIGPYQYKLQPDVTTT